MGYSDDPAMVRVDFFKPNGKWYTTEAVKWTGSFHGGPGEPLIHEAFRKSLRDHFASEGCYRAGGVRLGGLRAVCLEPYHEHACPICLDIPEEDPL